VRKKPLNVWLIDKEKKRYDLYQGNVSAMMEFLHKYSLRSVGWPTLDLTAPGVSPVAEPDRMSTCDLEYEFAPTALTVANDMDEEPNLVECSYDIKACAKNRDFPMSSSLPPSVSPSGRPSRDGEACT
jgi:hypothetical protein